MLKLHHLDNSRSQRILWLLEELGVDYEIVPYKRDKATRLAPPELKAIHPLGKSPVIEDDGLVLPESGAIVEYIIGKYGKGRLKPADGTAEHARYLYWMHFAEGTAMMQQLVRLYLGYAGEGAAPIIGRIDANIKSVLDFMETEVKPGGFLVGDTLTAADINMSFPLEIAAVRAGLTPAAYPKLAAMLSAMQARPAYRRGIERGGPYDFELKD